MNSGRDEATFWNFSDQLRLHTPGISSIFLGDNIWSESFLSTTSRRPEDRRNTESAAATPPPELSADANWNMGFGVSQKLAFTNNSLSRYSNSNLSGGDSVKATKVYSGDLNQYNGEIDNNCFSKTISRPAVNSNSSGVLGKKKNENIVEGGKTGKKNSYSKDSSNSNGGSALDKRFKTLPSSEALPRSEAVGGYIFVCNNETMEENLKRQLFGLPPRYRDSVRAITPGLPIFLYNYSTHQLHGIFESASFGGANIESEAWEDKRHPGESRFPAQIRVVARKNCEPLEEDSFRPILHHYDGPKFRLELNIPEVVNMLAANKLLRKVFA